MGLLVYLDQLIFIDLFYLNYLKIIEIKFYFKLKRNIYIYIYICVCVFFFFFLRNKHTHIQERGKSVLTQRHTTTPLKSHGNF